MAVDPFACSERDVHVRPQKTFYPSKIPVSHNQLRHLVSSPSPNVIFFVNGRDVYRLDTPSKKRTHILELPFETRCTASGHGWFCAGGEKHGHFAAIKLPEESRLRPTGADSPLSLPNARDSLLSSLSHPDLYERGLPYRLRHEQLGEEIVNSISIHQLRGADNGGEDDVVAVLTNNDMTVRTYSLTKNVELTIEEFDFPMNHATISPNGRILIVVGDKEWGYIYTRKTKRSSSSDDEVPVSPLQWTFLRKLRLHKPPRAKVSGYFTTAWSSTGKLCAAASEHGYVTVFDTEKLLDAGEDPVVAIVPSSRPNTTPGAVRTMCFAPDPWDLLMWTENCGRMCVADLRSGLMTRQVVHLEPQGENVTKSELSDASSTIDSPELRDFDLEIESIRRHQRAIGNTDSAAAVSFATDYLAASAERRRLQREAGVPELDDDPHGLTEQERQILDGLRTTRRREQAMLQTERRELAQLQAEMSGSPRSSPHSINYSPPGSRNGSQTPGQSDQSRERRQQEAAVLGSIREYMRGSRFEESNIGQGRAVTQQPRRRSSVIISPSHMAGDSARASASASPAANAAPASAADPWRTIEAAMRSATPYASTSANPPAASNPRDGNFDDDALPELLPVPPSSRNRVTLPNLRERVAYLDAERRRIQQLTSEADASGVRLDALTTRGEAMLARQRDRERDWRRDPASLGAYEASFLRRMAASVRTGGADNAGTPGFVGTYADGVEDVEDVPDWGVGTTGVAWDDGGRIVYVGTEEGIFELKMDFHERKFWPAVTPR